MNMIENGYTVVSAGAFKTCIRLATPEKIDTVQRKGR